VLFLLAPYKVPAGPLEHTALAALHDLRLQPGAEGWEYSGFIVYRDGTYQYTMFPHTDRQPDRTQFDVAAHMLFTDKLVGIYHNHPCISRTHYVQYFSVSDLISAKAYGVPAFLLNNCTGDVHVFDWAVDHVRDTGADVQVHRPDGKDVYYHLPAGRLVGNIGITSPQLDKLP
jgi:proteasome lid subunit RPN8/RPN11